MSSASRGACAGPRDGTCRLGKIKQVSAFRLVELECFGERVKHLWGGTADDAAFELGVVLHAHPGQGGEKAPSYAELDESTKQRIRTPGTSGEAVDPVHGKYSWYSIEVAHPMKPVPLHLSTSTGMLKIGSTQSYLSCSPSR